MRFRWNNDWQSGLDAFERQQVARHENGHLAGARTLSEREKRETHDEIAAFERGESCAEPLPAGQMCCLTAQGEGKDWNVAKDYAINPLLDPKR